MLRNALSFYWPKNKISCKPTVYRKSLFFSLYFGGERGIRTPGTVARTPHFECGPIDHSGISPNNGTRNPRFGTANIEIIFY